MPSGRAAPYSIQEIVPKMGQCANRKVVPLKALLSEFLGSRYFEGQKFAREGTYLHSRIDFFMYDSYVGGICLCEVIHNVLYRTYVLLYPRIRAADPMSMRNVYANIYST
jgi:hypothetical protein